METVNQALLASGIGLFFIGLINGLTIPMGRSPRLNLSAHLTAVQSGTFLIAAGLMWPHIAWASGWAVPTAHVLWISLYLLWLALALAGLAGAGARLPIAGQGIRASTFAEGIVAVLLAVSILGSIVATGAAVFFTLF